MFLASVVEFAKKVYITIEEQGERKAAEGIEECRLLNSTTQNAPFPF
jgi:hypothetical protein